jgi:hypothetical protein
LDLRPKKKNKTPNKEKAPHLRGFFYRPILRIDRYLTVRSRECAPPATVQHHHMNAALPPASTPIAAANTSDVRAPMEGRMFGKIFAVTFVIGLLVTGSAAFVANHPHALAACASGCD